MAYTTQLLFAIASRMLIATCHGAIIERVQCDTSGTGDIYGYSSVPLNGSVLDTVEFEEYRGQVLLITNVASYNSRTTERYIMLNNLMTEYSVQSFTVLGYPSTQFNKEEPGATATEIFNAIKYVRPGNGFVPNFMLFDKTNVNGAGEDEIFTFLKSNCSYTEEEFNTDLSYDSLNVYDVRQPFEMFLVGKTGKAEYRYHASLSDTQTLRDDIDALLLA